MRSIFLTVAAGLWLNSCSGIAPSEVLLTLSEGEVLFFGTVQTINDAVPVDGGVTILLRSENGETVTAYLQSFYRMPPPEQWEWDLYEVIRELHIGDTITIKGPLTESGIRITGIRKL